MIKTILKFLLVQTIFKLLLEIFLYIKACIKNKVLWKNVQNTWIMVTGATDGIGKELALQIAKKKLKLILVGRNLQKLEELEKEVSLTAKEVKIIMFDYEKDTKYNIFRNLNVGLLINNAGVSSKHPSYFYEDNVKEILQVNLSSTMLITKVIIDEMIKKKFGYVINVGSILGEAVCPFLATYSATKAAIKNWSNSLYYECKQFSVHVECVLPGMVCTKMSARKKPNFFAPSASHFAKRMLSTIGESKINIPYFPHLLQNFIIHLIPGFVYANILKVNLSAVRKYAMSKNRHE